jgi:hypothetical protein
VCEREKAGLKVVLFDFVFLQHKTIDSVLERGEKLDSLVEKSSDLSMASQVFTCIYLRYCVCSVRFIIYQKAFVWSCSCSTSKQRRQISVAPSSEKGNAFFSADLYHENCKGKMTAYFETYIL